MSHTFETQFGGKTPVIASFAAFITCNAYDQLRMAVAYPRLNVKVVGSHAGISIGEDGASQMGIEDVALACSLPGFTVIVPADEASTRAATLAMLQHQGPVYLRVGRPDVPKVYTDAQPPFAIGKANELRDIVIESGADTVICDGELSPGQLIHLEDVVKVKVIDRTALILDIFAQHAKSREGKAQVALAHMQYMLPRLRGWGQSLSRQMGGGKGGGLATRGPGETKIETDRRRIREKMAKMRREIAEMKTGRDLKRQERKRNKVPSVAIAGYTNAGKSSLLNRLTGAGVLVENALFATLDPTVRRAETPTGRIYTLADTVGFVRHLPHHLVEAFRSTMEEVGDSDLILHIVDGSHPAPEELGLAGTRCSSSELHPIPWNCELHARRTTWLELAPDGE